MNLINSVLGGALLGAWGGFRRKVLTSMVGLMGMAPVGLMVAGPLADRFGIQTWFLIGGAFCVATAVTGLCLPPVMNIEG